MIKKKYCSHKWSEWVRMGEKWANDSRPISKRTCCKCQIMERIIIEKY